MDPRLCLSLCPGCWHGAGSLDPTGSITAGILLSAFSRVLDVTAVICLSKSSSALLTYAGSLLLLLLKCRCLVGEVLAVQLGSLTLAVQLGQMAQE